MTNSSGDRFFQGSLIFERYVNLFFFRAFFVNITNLVVPTYKTEKKNRKIIQLCAQWKFLLNIV